MKSSERLRDRSIVVAGQNRLLMVFREWREAARMEEDAEKLYWVWAHDKEAPDAGGF